MHYGNNKKKKRKSIHDNAMNHGICTRFAKKKMKQFLPHQFYATKISF